MKDITISAARQKKELGIAVACFAAAVLVNVYSIIHFHTRWTEVFTQVGFTVVVAAILYVISIICRIPFLLLKRKKK